ncbi:hypothetical protein ERJ75_001826000 [Trypanosoma vivax]|uniref:Chromosomal passenger protein n=1 Tax=Trypanosoma vivax (strain Y486) TaxID=1055687 RepID=G0U8Z3_TRYVY|nr:hypothetical protein TRVL_03474 [Trypanosoma vivax]KAH8603549.1 hypothetical protein ERJ75_001826000 [Trypanosoma vivax]CCC54075.1 conserved hypothetical protein [Trypanosoma vivax Y486]
MQRGNGDYFEGLRALPRDPRDLRHHPNRLNYILQKRYLIAPEAAELALNPQNTEEFHRYYRHLVMRIVGQFNTSTRSQLKVRVDPHTPKGIQLIRQGATSKSAVTTHPRSARSEMKTPERKILTPDVEQRKQAHCRKEPDTHYMSEWLLNAEFSNTKGKEQGEQRLEAFHTPQKMSPKYAGMTTHDGCSGTGGKSFFPSDDPSDVPPSVPRASCQDVVFDTPPEFKGFTGGMEVSPADSLTTRSPLNF